MSSSSSFKIPIDKIEKHASQLRGEKINKFVEATKRGEAHPERYLYSNTATMTSEMGNQTSQISLNSSQQEQCNSK